MAGIRKFPILGAFPLEFMETFCGIICFMDPYYSAKFHPSATNAVVAIHLCYLRTYLPTYYTDCTNNALS